jgi:hypothetical protein
MSDIPSQDDIRIKQAVKEALSERDMGLVKNQLTGLETQIQKGFDGVHERQNITNGKVLKSREDIIELQNEGTILKDKVAFLYKLILGIGGVIGVALLGAVMKVILR